MGSVTIPENVEQIKTAVDAGKDVFYKNANYQVIKDGLGQYLITCNSNGYTIGLTHRDGVTLNDKPDRFVIVNLDDEYCPNYPNDKVLPNEQGNCSLCNKHKA